MHAKLDINQFKDSKHFPVLSREVMHFLLTKEEGVYIDATFGNGGYSELILSSNPKNQVLAIDRDPSVAGRASELQAKYGSRLSFSNDLFGNIDAVAKSANIKGKVDGIVFDLGVSSMQIDDPLRGFSFKKDGKLSMEMGCNQLDAAYIVNNYPKERLANIIFEYGEEKKSRAVANAIVNLRPITSTRALAEAIYSAIGRGNPTKIDNATRTFQAIRIEVNQELEQIKQALDACVDILAPKGRLVVVSFHSLEDRIVKQFIKKRSSCAAMPSRYLPALEEKDDNNMIVLQNLTKKAIVAQEDELNLNPRSRSAKLRACEKK